jgi:putative ABC transport system permease protein
VNVLLSLVVLLFLVAALASVATWSLTRTTRVGLPAIIALIAVPVFDAAISSYFLDWMGIGGATRFVGGFSFGMLSLVFVQPLLVPQRLVVWRIAKETLLRRKRQAALLMLGLIIASSIITSSLVVGDSLDATVQYEVEGAWGETDITISGLDLSTGERVIITQSVADEVWARTTTDPSLQSALLGQQQGIVAGVSVQGEDLSLPSITWLAFNSTIDAEGEWPRIGGQNGVRYGDIALANTPESPLSVVVNEVLADELDLKSGSSVELGWYVTEENRRTRVTQNATVLQVVENSGQGAAAGTSAPALFTDLATAQRLQQMTGELNTIYYAISSSYDHATAIEGIVEGIEFHLDEAMSASDVGIQIEVDTSTDGITVSSNRGLGRVSGSDVAALRENLTALEFDAMLEVLQVPLIELEHQDEGLLTLSSSAVTDLVSGQRGLWHVSGSGFGFQIDGGGDAWVWRVSEGESVHGFAMDSSGIYGVVSTSQGITVGSEAEPDEDEWASFRSDGEMVAIASVLDGWLAVELIDETLVIHSFSTDLSVHAQQTLTVPLPSNVVDVEMYVEDGIYLEIEGLLSIDRYFTGEVNVFSEFEEFDTGDWPQPAATVAEVPLQNACNGVASLSLFDPIEHWCTYDTGIMRWDAATGAVQSIRLPILSSAGGFGTMPQMMLAFGGESAPFSVTNGSVELSQRLAKLNLVPGQEDLWVKGLIPYAFGDDTSYRLTYNGYYSEVEGLDGLSELDSVILGLISLEDAETLASAGPDERSILVLTPSPDTSNASFERLTSWFDERSGSEDLNLQVRAVKIEAAALAAESSGVLAGMFLVFGSFTIAAGVLLVLTIVLMLAEARRSEFGTLRSLGMSQSDARSLAVMEGAMIAVVAGGLGSLVGLGLAWFISIGFQNMFSSVGSGQFLFAWETGSIFAGWVWGFLLALSTLWGSAVWTARTNIVVALRGGREATSSSVSWLIVLIQILFFGVGALSLALLAVVGLDSSFAYFAWVVSGVCMLIAIIPILSLELPSMFKHRNNRWANLHRHSGRNTLAALGLSLLIWTVGLHSIDPVRKGMAPDEFSFIVLGLVEVFAGVLLLTSAAPVVVGRLGKSKLLTKRFGPVLPVALAHPLSSPVRTAVVMGMFSITVFSVVVLGGYAEQFDNYSSSFVDEAEGDYELLLKGSRARPIDLPSQIDEWNLSESSTLSIDSVARIQRSQVFLENADGDRMPYLLRGFDSNFSQHGGLPLYMWDESLGSTEQQAWMAVGERDDLVIVDASFGLESIADGSGLTTLSFSIGESISLIDTSNPGNTKNVKIAGFMEQSSYLFSAGVWISDEVAIDQFDGRLTRMYVSVSESATPSIDFEAADSEVSPMGKSNDVRLASLELEEELNAVLSDDGVQVSVIATDVMVIQSLVLSLLAIFEAYLSLGLIVGIAGIGVVTVRSVSERTKTIGILRALGYRRSMVMATFLIEVAWVAMLGMLNGALIAVGFHRALYETFWKDQGASFSLPYGSILTVVVGGMLLVLIATAYPIRKASAVPPSAALRAP